MKLRDAGDAEPVFASHPSRGAWIEIREKSMRRIGRRSHPSRGAWIEIFLRNLAVVDGQSHPSRGAWIEIERWRGFPGRI